MKISKKRLNNIIQEEYTRLKMSGLITEMTHPSMAYNEDIASELIAELQMDGPTDAKVLAQRISAGYLGSSEHAVFETIDALLDEGMLYFDDDGIVFLLPDHQAQLMQTGVY